MLRPSHLNKCLHRSLANSYSSPFHLRNARTFTTGSSKDNESPESDSIFSPQASPWEHVFSDIKEMPPLLPFVQPRSPTAGRTRVRRQAMTAREISAFDEMFDMIFDAASEKKTTYTSSYEPNVELPRGSMGNLFKRLRRDSKKMKWTSESDEVLDRKKEEMDLCNTDQQLLGWAMREVFDESQQYEEASRKASSTVSQSELPKESPMLQSPAYSHLVALLMRTFRDKYHDPHLALAIFHHARHLSAASYVFGCSTQTYNELIETRWSCFRDLKGVYDALEEMKANGIDTDTKTGKLIDRLRRETGERNLWVEENELGSGEVWNMLAKIEDSVAKPSTSLSKTTTTPMKWDEWKALSLDDDASDDWGFNQWDKSKLRPKRESKGRPLDRKGHSFDLSNN